MTSIVSQRIYWRARVLKDVSVGQPPIATYEKDSTLESDTAPQDGVWTDRIEGKYVVLIPVEHLEVQKLLDITTQSSMTLIIG